MVPEFNASVKAAATSIAGEAMPDADLLGAQLVGRWKSGAAIINAPTADDMSVADGTPDTNAFEFGDDRIGVKCPWAAHVRKAYPRNDVLGETELDEGVPEERGCHLGIAEHAGPFAERQVGGDEWFALETKPCEFATEETRGRPQ